MNDKPIIAPEGAIVYVAYAFIAIFAVAACALIAWALTHFIN